MQLKSCLVVTVMACAIPGLACAGTPVDTLRPGTVTDTVHSLGDPGETYALYLPAAYSKSRQWPVLFLMDPRGRALVPLRLFRAAAEQYGYIVMSSYQTQSDGPIEPNDKAVNAMLGDAQSRFSVDARRFYFAGFSGTGRIAWYYGYSIPDNAAGLIEVGAGLPTPDFLLQKSVAKTSAPFAVFLSVGTTDFNYDEVQALDARLGSFGVRHHLQTFDGSHSWPPESVCADAITWLQLQGMRDGRLPRNSRWVDSLFTATAATADSLSRINQYSAAIHYRQLAADFGGLHDTVSAAALATRMADSDAAKRTGRKVARLRADNQSALEREESFFSEFSQARAPASLDKLRSQLGLDDLRDRARQTADTLDAFAAKRLLASINVRASFYEPRRYLEQGDTLKALSMYALSQSIHPEDGQLCAERERLYKQFAVRKSVPRELSCDRAR